VESYGPAPSGRLAPPNWLREAPVTRTLLALNIAVFLMQAAITRSFSELPSRTALELGASYALATAHEWRVETLVTACFLHAGLVHLGFNMLALWQAGPLVERAVGSARMAPMYLAAGLFGNALSTASGILSGSASFTVGASGAISGVIAAALVVGWRVQGWRGPLTQAMARWLGFVVVFGVLSNLSGGRIDNSAHLGGAVAGAAIAAMWKRGRRYSPAATARILVGCAVGLLGCIAVLGWHDRTDRFAAMTLQDRADFTREALASGRCSDAYEGLSAVERLRAKAAPVTPLHTAVDMMCR
jgi:rhomboid protease GluP